MRLRVVLALWLLVSARPDPIAAGDGEGGARGAVLFAERCAACHLLGVIVPPLEGLAKFPRDRLMRTMDGGMMQDMAAGLDQEEMEAIAAYIGDLGGPAPEPRADSSACLGRSPIGENGAYAWSGWAPDATNKRYLARTDLDVAAIQGMRLKWAFVFPDTASTETSANQPTVAGGRLYISNVSGVVYALDALSGCTYWRFEADAGIRSAIVVTGDAVVFGDFAANVYSLDAASGTLRWRTRVDEQPTARVSGNVAVDGTRVYVPVSGMQETYGIHPRLPCCTFRGSVVAVDLATGAIEWKTWTIEQTPRALGTTAAGVERFGPSGVAVWSVPTVDAERGLLYVTTGNQYTEPVVAESDAVMALDLDTGTKRWIRNFAPREMGGKDVYHLGCEAFVDETRSRCSPVNPQGRGDREFGAPVLLHTDRDGRQRLLAGSKDGMLYALDPERHGKLLWSVRLGRGGEMGGIQYGLSASPDTVFAAVADLNGDMTADGALNAVDVRSGRVLWRTPTPGGSCEGRPPLCSNAQTAAVTALPTVVFSGAMDGYLRAHDNRTGEVIWSYDTTATVRGVNGLDGGGGSIGASGPTIAGNMLYQTSGMEWIGVGMGGRVLLAFDLEVGPARSLW